MRGRHRTFLLLPLEADRNVKVSARRPGGANEDGINMADGRWVAERASGDIDEVTYDICCDDACWLLQSADQPATDKDPHDKTPYDNTAADSGIDLYPTLWEEDGQWGGIWEGFVLLQPTGGRMQRRRFASGVWAEPRPQTILVHSWPQKTFLTLKWGSSQ